MTLGRLLRAVLLLGTLAAPAWAAQWYEHYEQGLELAGRGAWEEALESFRAAERFRPEPAERARTYGNRFLFSYDPHFQQARCLVELALPEAARAALARSAAAGVTSPAELATLEERIVAVERRARADTETESAAGGEDPRVDRRPGPAETSARAPARLAVTSTPPGAAVSIDGRAVGRTPLPGEQVAPGRHRVRVGGEGGYEASEQEVEVAPGERVHLTVTLSRRVEGRPGPPADEEAAEGTSAGAREPIPPVAEQPSRADPPPVSSSEGDAPSPEAAGTDRSAAAEPEGSPEGVVPAQTPSAAGANRPARPTGGGPPASSRFPWGPVVSGSALLLVAAGLLALRTRRRRRAAATTAGPGAGASRRIGDRVGPYRIEDVLGRGGMAITYRARRRRDGRAVALKIPHETGDPTYLERFLREGRLGETLHHPGIVRILEAGEEDGRPYLAMELLPGRTLRQVLDGVDEPPTVERALAIAREIAEALDYAHGKGVVHRDLKPENVMVLPDGRLQVMDFGVARVEGQPGLTTSSFFFGSPVYAAPELVDPRSIDHRADLYSLGVLLYELLEGEPPFVHESVFRLLELHQHAPLPAPESLPRPLPPEVWRMVSRLLAKDPEARHGSAQELLVELNRYLHREAAADGTRGAAAGPG